MEKSKFKLYKSYPLGQTDWPETGSDPTWKWPDTRMAQPENNPSKINLTRNPSDPAILAGLVMNI